MDMKTCFNCQWASDTDAGISCDKYNFHMEGSEEFEGHAINCPDYKNGNE